MKNEALLAPIEDEITENVCGKDALRKRDILEMLLLSYSCSCSSAGSENVGSSLRAGCRVRFRAGVEVEACDSNTDCVSRELVGPMRACRPWFALDSIAA